MGIIARRDKFEKDGWQRYSDNVDVKVENGVVMKIAINTPQKFEGLLNIVKSNPPDEINDIVEDDDEYIQIRLNRIECKLDSLVETINKIYDASKGISSNS